MRLYSKFYPGEVSGFWLCKLTNWFLCKWIINTKWVIPNNYWAKTINALLKTAPSTITFFHVLFHLKIKKLELFAILKLAISIFLDMWRFHDLPFTPLFSVLPFLPLLQLLECLNRYMCGCNFTMKLPLDFHNYTGLNRLVSSFSSFTISPRNKLILGCKPY